MINDARKIATGSELSCQVCVIGAGAAGITLVMELARAGIDVIVLEAGNLKSSGASIELYRGEVLDTKRHQHPDSDRYRQFGGTTSLWGGRCIPFDVIDFEQRDYVPNSGWPITYAEMEPYYRRAHEYCECGDYNYRVNEVFPDGPDQLVAGLADGEVVSTTIERWSPPTHFGNRYQSTIRSSKTTRVLLNAVCLSLERHANGQSISHVHVTTFSQNRFVVRPRVTILAGGGLEVTRLLLSSKDSDGIGNHSGWLGRGYMCHVNGVLARIRFRQDAEVVFGYEKDKDGVYCRRRFWFSEHAQRHHELPNMYLLLDRPMMGDPGHGNGLLSLAFLVKSLVSRVIQPISFKGKYGLYWQHMKNVLAGSPEILKVLPKWSRERMLQGRRIPSLLLDSKDNSFYLYYQAEQIPNPDSRITLSDDLDRFGIPRLRIDYRFTDTDVDAIIRAHDLLDRELRRQGCGELVYSTEDHASVIRSHKATLGHHIGTTRMAADPANGVVNPDCQVYGISNLYISSSSVFPTCSQANPTLTIVAMAIRLGDYIKANLAAS